MTTHVSISASIPASLGDMLGRVAKAEERSKSYYIRKGLERILKERIQDLEDYQEAKEAYEAFVSNGEEGVPLEVVFKDVK